MCGTICRKNSFTLYQHIWIKETELMLITYLLFIVAYLLGSIPFALVVGKIGYGIDIREHGSGNLGGTNTFRTLGKSGLHRYNCWYFKRNASNGFAVNFRFRYPSSLVRISSSTWTCVSNFRKVPRRKSSCYVCWCTIVLCSNSLCDISHCLFHPAIYDEIRFTFFYGNSCHCCYCSNYYRG